MGEFSLLLLGMLPACRTYTTHIYTGRRLSISSSSISILPQSLVVKIQKKGQIKIEKEGRRRRRKKDVSEVLLVKAISDIATTRRQGIT